jgi:predicted  nucleic acid-binding Zn-ribbon protein
LAHQTGTANVTDIGRKLETARTQVEKRFLDGGSVLLAVMDVLNSLLASLDNVTRTLDAGAANDTTADLLATVSNLSDLPRLESLRQTNLAILSSSGAGLRTHVADMQETMRYLQTFAVTVKITGAGISEFAGFAEEILDRIRSGTGEVNNFAGQLNALEKELKVAQTFGSGIAQRYEQTVPAVAGALQRDAQTITAHRKKLGEIAKQVGLLARGVQSKVATTLSALQIGDITRQRIEHVQSTLAILDEFLDSDEGRTLDGDAQSRLQNLVHHLAAAQMVDMFENFQRDSRSVVETIASFSHDTQDILNLRAEMQSEDDANGGNFMRALEESVSAAHAIVKQVETASQQANQVSQSTTATAANLLKGIENIRAVKMDIHYMALNTNLRCSRMGEEGRSINVVTAELRFFAAKLDESADAIVNGLAGFEEAATAIAASDNTGGPGLAGRLSAAVSNIRSAANAMEAELAVLSEHGREVASKIGVSISKLDFQNDLGEVLATCADDLCDLAGDTMPDVSDLGDVLGGLGPRIFKLYTMAQERTVHQAVIPAGTVVAAPVAAANDDELFADTLF